MMIHGQGEWFLVWVSSIKHDMYYLANNDRWRRHSRTNFTIHPARAYAHDPRYRKEIQEYIEYRITAHTTRWQGKGQ